MSQTGRIDLPFAEFFKKATGFPPYKYQERLSEGSIPDMLKIPTGAGKTEAAVLAIWMWRRLSPDGQTRSKTPRRLVYCLPMRTLVEQTRARIDEWLKNSNLAESVRVVTMMGGGTDAKKMAEYRLRPEDDMIIIGTQDMLLSRALNRGYGVSIFACPQEFGMMNNDCIWVLDEIQLMNDGLATSVQLDAFREKMGAYGPRKTVWMSATAEPEWLRTVDAKDRAFDVFELGKSDFAGVLGKRSGANKTLHVMDVKKGGNVYDKKDAKNILAKHESGTMTLVIVNTVKRAQSLYGELSKIAKEPTEILLVHSRFRGQDKARFKDRLMAMAGNNAQKDVIVVSTQVVEAGLDISARTMVTEMAPWPSLVQRFGRCNRYGEFPDSKIHVITLKPAAGSVKYPPYDDQDMDGVADAVKDGQSASPQSLGLLPMPPIRHEHVIRKPHMLDLFDTTADIAGSHTDVSRYVRSIENSTDVYVFWREWDNGKGPEPGISAEPGEICSVPVWDITDAKNRLETHVYDHLSGRWNKIGQRDIRPGQTVLLHRDQGRYTDEVGWDPKSTKRVNVEEHRESKADSLQRDDSSDRAAMTLNDHTVHVHDEMASMLQDLPHLDKSVKDILLESAVLHDVGKAHDGFQSKIDKPDGWKGEICGKGRFKSPRTRFVRHEAASALAVLQWHADSDVRTNSVAYLSATHHGKVGMAMRPIYHDPERDSPDGGADGLAGKILGISADKSDEMEVFLSKDSATSNSREDRIIREYGKTVKIKADVARIGAAEDGRKSWLQITLGLLEEYGPFKLAYMEAVMRAADQRASRKDDGS